MNTDTDTENNFDEQHQRSYLRCFRKVKKSCKEISNPLDTKEDRIIRRALLRNIEIYQRLHRINTIYKEMYSLVKKLLCMHENQEIYDNGVIDDMIKKSERDDKKYEYKNGRNGHKFTMSRAQVCFERHDKTNNEHIQYTDTDTDTDTTNSSIITYGIKISSENK